jgi:hypothetical protein
MAAIRNGYKYLLKILKGGHFLEDLSVDGKVILSYRNMESVDWTKLAEGRGLVTGFCKHSSKQLSSIRDYQLFKNESPLN